MLFLILSILSSTLVFIVFKIINQVKVNILSAIIINYFVACSAGFFLNYSYQIPENFIRERWFLLSILLGILFIIMLFTIGTSTEKAGVTVTTVASKMSVIFPIIFSIWLDNTSDLSPLKIFGIVITLLAVFLTLYKSNNRKIDISSIYLPIILFFGIGLIDSLIKYAQVKYISNELNPFFSAITFGIAGIAGIIVLPFNRKARLSYLHLKTWVLGIILGSVNFGTVYFLIGALNHINTNTGEQAEGFALFGINNICIVALSALIGLLVFKEKLLKLNWVGISLSILGIILLIY